MRHHNTVFHGILNLVPWSVLDRLVDRYRANKRVRRLSTQNQFVAMLYAQLSDAQSLRAIEASFESHATRLYHLGARELSRSTLADANAKRSSAVFTALLSELMGRCERDLAGKLAGAVYLVDSTGFRLTSLSAEWARFCSGVHGVKLHIVYNPDRERPSFAELTPANVNDITVAKAMPIRPGATYVFDLGYYDYGWWAQLDNAGCRLVTRLKVNTPLVVTAENKVPEGSCVLSDRIGLLPARQAKSRKNPFKDPVREITVRTETGKILRIVTNDLDAPADEIAELYKRRWQIELFFRWIKHTLKIRHFFGTSENAVRIQIAIALIAFLLLRMAHTAQSSVENLLTFTRLVAQNLMHRRRIDRLLDPPPPIIKDDRQMSLSLGQI
ncbi:IS4 family transposase [Bradyrhizobium sp. ISRA443]|uniref:IS4 family transposase n=1 Tax=unclassified Bradyrhizobium TaxID=2631580 RepID=UPI00247B22F9|nr:MULTISPECIES: IS4 family transposase [unclassified Bradyrhizobium]WGR92470.1 IS4 family transposase [Bradyrhizobium sp. ISRA435]WGR94549.1 IS4 family transposase [Bradyrhizobium sp. ISRA435]WGR94985.1 IS4 family transposase [Bradyrhizobium sp. ISRA435]WGR96846.1 IS4 family transposase [Bradyrhizobium sp. ISRA436]WGR99299.1 IS4 family transposase [Bradyrhizobium sp. ISRA436]